MKQVSPSFVSIYLTFQSKVFDDSARPSDVYGWNDPSPSVRVSKVPETWRGESTLGAGTGDGTGTGT